jgi:response regulator RpfG family c-di-GMP phosphodiesterase
MMLGMSGATVSAKLRDNEKTKNIPIIFLTGLFHEEKSGNKDINNSENDFISKSSDLNTQINQIKKALGN